MNARLGILGGSFNPIHFGHLHIARRAQELFRLDRVHFVVATSPPHKPPEGLVPFAHRYAMVCLAVAGFPRWIPSLAELEPPVSPYSVDTLNKFSRANAGQARKLYFIAGTDSLLDVATWRKSEELLRTYNFVFAVRRGAEVLDVQSALPAGARARVLDLRTGNPAGVRRLAEREASRRQSRVFIVDLAAPGISASQVRSLASSGRSLRRLVPDPVRSYIQKLNLYGAQCKKH